MLIGYCLSWWYGRGWKWRFAKGTENIAYWAEYFSIGKLLSTMFSPYRQISGSHRGVQGFMDSLVSRFVGFFVRFFILLAGGLLLFFYTIVTFLLVLIWPLIPLVPVFAIILAVAGVTL